MAMFWAVEGLKRFRECKIGVRVRGAGQTKRTEAGPRRVMRPLLLLGELLELLGADGVLGRTGHVSKRERSLGSRRAVLLVVVVVVVGARGGSVPAVLAPLRVHVVHAVGLMHRVSATHDIGAADIESGTCNRADACVLLGHVSTGAGGRELVDQPLQESDARRHGVPEILR